MKVMARIRNYFPGGQQHHTPGCRSEKRLRCHIDDDDAVQLMFLVWYYLIAPHHLLFRCCRPMVGVCLCRRLEPEVGRVTRKRFDPLDRKKIKLNAFQKRECLQKFILHVRWTWFVFLFGRADGRCPTLTTMNHDEP